MNKGPIVAIIAGVLTIIGGELLKLNTGTAWHELWTPQFLGALLFQTGGLIAAVAGGVAYQRQDPVPKVDLAKLGKPLLVLALAGTMGASSGCALKGAARHDLTVPTLVANDVLIDARDFESAHWADLTETAAQHQAFQGRMYTALTDGRDLDKAILAWPANTPATADVIAAARALKPVILDALALLPDGAWKTTLVTKLQPLLDLINQVAPQH